MLAWGLNIVVGLAGLLDLGYVAFYAVGAYAYALLGTHFGLSFWILLPAAGFMAAMWGVMLGFPVLRLRGDYLAIVTLAFGEIIRLVLINWREVTNGSAGIAGIPKVTFFGLMSFDVSADNYIGKVLGIAASGAYYKIFLYYLIVLLCLLTAFVTVRLRRLPIGRAWEALREDEIACRSLGINTTTTKLTAFAIGAMFAGFAGSFFAARQGFVSPESFVYLESAIVLAIVVLGGMGSLGGIAVAAMVMIGGTEILREMGFLKMVFGEGFTPELYRMLLFGLAVVLVMLWKPRGFVGSREPTAFLHERKIGVGLLHQGRARLMNDGTMASPVLKLEHLSMKFGGLVAIGDLSFEAKRGEITALIGPNGAGKTTVFNCITGFYKPSEGMITLTSSNGSKFLLERMPDHEITGQGQGSAHFPEHPAVLGHDPAGEPAGGAAQQADEGVRLHRCSACSASRATGGRRRPRSSLPSIGWKRRGWSIAPTTRQATCPMARSDASRSRGPCAPGRSCFASTSRRPASTRGNRPNSTRC